MSVYELTDAEAALATLMLEIQDTAMEVGVEVLGLSPQEAVEVANSAAMKLGAAS
jgi:hypothetical protein